MDLRLDLSKDKVENSLESLVRLLGLRDQLLDDVSALLVNREIEDLPLQSLLHKFLIQGQLNIVEDGLDSVRTTLIAAYLGEVGLDQLQDLGALLDRHILQQLLAEVVPVAVHHDHCEVLANVTEDKLNEVAIGFCKLFLHVSAAWLRTC